MIVDIMLQEPKSKKRLIDVKSVIERNYDRYYQKELSWLASWRDEYDVYESDGDDLYTSNDIVDVGNDINSFVFTCTTYDGTVNDVNTTTITSDGYAVARDGDISFSWDFPI